MKAPWASRDDETSPPQESPQTTLRKAKLKELVTRFLPAHLRGTLSPMLLKALDNLDDKQMEEVVETVCEIADELKRSHLSAVP